MENFDLNKIIPTLVNLLKVSKTAYFWKFSLKTNLLYFRKTNIIILNSTHLKSKHKKAIENKIIKNHQVVIGFNLPKKKKNLNNNFNKTKKIILKNFSGLEDRIRFLVLSKISSINFYK